MATLLPDPMPGERQDGCLRCGYALLGMGDTGLCPECGTPYFEPGNMLVVHGVAKVQETVTWRRWAWIALIVLGAVYSQTVVLFIFSSPIVGLLLFAMLLAGVAGMVVSGSSAKQGSERFVFTPAGISRTPAWTEGTPQFQPWGAETRADLRRVGAVWYRLRLTDYGSGKPVTLLDAGVRCRDDDRQWVASTLDRFVRGEPNPVVEGLPDDPTHP